MPELPYVNFYCSDWLGDSKVRRMGPEARGHHIDLICHSWQEPLPADKEELAEMLGVQRRKFDSLWLPKLSTCWTVEGEHIVNKRLEKEREKQRKKRGGGD